MPAKKKAQEEEPLELHSLQKDREQEERLERERLQREQELQQARNAEKDRLRQLEIDQERQQREEEEAEREREQAERKRLLREQEEADRRAREEAEEFPTTMTVQQFKALWSTLATSGSFQCQLKAPPLIPTLTEHLRKQGFHIVFAASPNGDIEVGVSNIRSKKAEPWFMARFLATTTSFSAVMKAEDSNLVTVYVKKFALAKVLKIDTTKK